MPTPDAIFHKRWGSVALTAYQQRPLLFVEARGYVGPALLKGVLAYGRPFGEQFPQGWDYAVDTTRLTLAHPINPYYLRQIHHLPHLRRYIVIPPQRFPLNLLNPVVDWLVKPDLTINSVQELFTDGKS